LGLLFDALAASLMEDYRLVYAIDAGVTIFQLAFPTSQEGFCFLPFFNDGGPPTAQF
jgi:hypothetical protein